MLTHSELCRLLRYDPTDGKFIWLIKRQKIAVGAEAGFMHRRKRDGWMSWRIKVRGRLYLRSRLAWFYMMGEWPSAQVDHADRNSVNDAWSNLRGASASQNQANATKRKGCMVPLKGVCLHKAGKFQAQIKRDGKTKYLGLFDTAEAAHEAYVTAASLTFGKFARAA